MLSAPFFETAMNFVLRGFQLFEHGRLREEPWEPGLVAMTPRP